MGVLDQSLADQGFLPMTRAIISQGSWSAGTQASYNGVWNLWSAWCREKSLPVSPTASTAVQQLCEYLAELSAAGRASRTVRSHCSALANFLPKVAGDKISTNLNVQLVLRGAWRNAPPLPRYQVTWDIDQLLLWWRDRPEPLSLFDLSRKTLTLLAVASCGRIDDVVSLQLPPVFHRINGEVVQVDLSRSKPPKQQRGGPIRPVTFVRSDVPPCPVSTLLRYIETTAEFRRQPVTPLFLTTTGKHTPISKQTGARWLHSSMRDAGVDTSSFKPHSVCAAAASKKISRGASLADLVKSGRWRSTSTIKSHYLRGERTIHLSSSLSVPRSSSVGYLSL